MKKRVVEVTKDVPMLRMCTSVLNFLKILHHFNDTVALAQRTLIPSIDIRSNHQVCLPRCSQARMAHGMADEGKELELETAWEREGEGRRRVVMGD